MLFGGAFGGVFDPRERYADDGHWITIGSREVDGKHVGGSPVFIKDGRITKGAPSLTGKKLSAMHEPAQGQSVRAANKTEREYKRAKYAKEARGLGIRADDLHQMAADIHAHGNEYSRGRAKMLSEIKRVYPHFGIIAARHAKGGFDHTMTPGMDVAAKEFSADADYAHLWPRAGDADDLERVEWLFNLFAHGPGEEVSEDQAYEEAMDYLRSKSQETVPF